MPSTCLIVPYATRKFNKVFHENLMLWEQPGFHRPSDHCVNPCINVFHRAFSNAQCLVINTGTPVQEL